MHLLIAHETVYRYDRLVQRSTQYLRLTPRPGHGLKVLSWQLTLPAPASRCLDAYGNIMHVLTLDKPVSDIHLLARGEVETDDRAPTPDPQDELPAQLFLRDSPLTRADAALRQFAHGHAAQVASDPLAGLLHMMQALVVVMPYTPGTTDAATPAAEAFANQNGVCQDHAQVFATCARLLGLPARYVSGYIAPRHFGSGAAYVGAQASHAWLSLFTPGAGWVDLDPTNDVVASTEHITIAWGRNYDEVSPIRGVILGGGSQKLAVDVAVSRVSE